MTALIKHVKVSLIPDDADTDLVRPSDWNENHTVSGLTTAEFASANVSQWTNDSAYIANPMTTLGDVIYQNASVPTRLAGNTTTTQKFLSQTGDGASSAAPAWSDVQDADVVFTDVTSGDVSTAKHGFMPKLSGSTTTFYRSDGAQATPTGQVNSYIEQSFTSQTSVTVTHTFGAYPVVQVINSGLAVIIPLTITHNSVNAFTVTFSSSTTGRILATVGSPQPASYVTVTDNYAVLGGDYYVECTEPGKTMTLPTAVGREGQAFSLDNSSTGYMYIAMTGAETLQGLTSVSIGSNSTLVAVSNGVNYRIK